MHWIRWRPIILKSIRIWNFTLKFWVRCSSTCIWLEDLRSIFLDSKIIWISNAKFCLLDAGAYPSSYRTVLAIFLDRGWQSSLAVFYTHSTISDLGFLRSSLSQQRFTDHRIWSYNIFWFVFQQSFRRCKNWLHFILVIKNDRCRLIFNLQITLGINFCLSSFDLTL